MYLFRYIFFIIFVSLKNEKMKTITVSDFRKDIKKSLDIPLPAEYAIAGVSETKK